MSDLAFVATWWAVGSFCAAVANWVTWRRHGQLTASDTILGFLLIFGWPILAPLLLAGWVLFRAIERVRL